MQQLIELYKQHFGAAPLKAETLAKAGSNRVYVRFTGNGGGTVIGVVGQSEEENRQFVYLAGHFRSKGLPFPEVYAVSDDGMRYLQQDLGSRSLYQALEKGRTAGAQYSEEEIALIRRTLCLLPHIQVEGAEGLDFSRCLAPRRFDTQAALFDLHYFKYCFLKTTDLPYDELLLEEDFRKLAADLVACGKGHAGFLYRDFQARNVMLAPDGEPWFIDFQGGMQGPLQYDVASFLWQASARYPQTLREALIEDYLDELAKIASVDRTAFRKGLSLFVLFRMLQVLGAYGLRGYFERKKYFLDSIPSAIQSLRRQLLDGVCAPYPYLQQTLQELADLPQFNTPGQAGEQPCGKGLEEHKNLVVRVFSFSYKKGIPQDESGNGGGYVFDCRSTHNPGRYEPYKKLTGRDEAVIKFLEDDGEILVFLDSVYRLADAHVSRYLQRGFTNLMFSFGCTGGQHRSVYSAEHLAEHLNKKFGIEVRLCHREQGISRVLPAAGK